MGFYTSEIGLKELDFPDFKFYADARMLTILNTFIYPRRNGERDGQTDLRRRCYWNGSGWWNGHQDPVRGGTESLCVELGPRN